MRDVYDPGSRPSPDLRSAAALILDFPFPGDLPKPGIEPRSPALQVDSLPAESLGKPKNTGVGSLALLQESSRPRNQAGVSCIAGGFFIS